ncbi:hypothetical protein BDI4_300102 [Burkholderia diffusa]|nr:hypothetical protein BDI4_300102 [Burkholderia diffusa]
MVTNLAKIQFCGDGNRCLTNRCRQFAMQHRARWVPKGASIPGKPLSHKGDTDSIRMGQGLPLLTPSGRERKRRRDEIGKYFVMIWRRSAVAGRGPKRLSGNG